MNGRYSMRNASKVYKVRKVADLVDYKDFMDCFGPQHYSCVVPVRSFALTTSLFQYVPGGTQVIRVRVDESVV